MAVVSQAYDLIMKSMQVQLTEHQSYVNKSREISWVVEEYAFSPSALEAEAGGSL